MIKIGEKENGKKFVYVQVEKSKTDKLDQFVKSIIKEKSKETHHIIDGGSEYKRFYTGFLGELALEELLGIELIDWSIGKSNYYNIADLHKIGLNVGVKTVESGKCHIIHTNPKRPEIIMFKDEKRDDRILIMGVASIDIMKKYQDRNLIKSPNLKKRLEKTAFCGYKYINAFSSLEELKNVIKKA